MQVDGKSFSQPVLLGDPGAKNAKPDDKVVIEMVRFPSQSQDGEGVISEVLGPRGTPGVDTLVDHSRVQPAGRISPKTSLDEARAEADAFDEDDRGRAAPI